MRPGWLPGCLPGCLLVLLQLALHSARSQPSVGHFWHISDLHYDVNYSLDGDIRHNCRRWSGNGNGLGGTRENQRPDGRFGDLHCDAPLSLLESATTAMKDIAKEVDFILWTGAGPVSGHDQGAQATQVVTQLLLRAFTSQFVFPVLGPDMRHADHYKQAADLWRNWLPEEAMQTFYKGGYYMIEQKSKPLRIVALNTNLWLESPGRGGFSRDAWEPRRSREGVVGVVREPWEVRENRVHDEDPAMQFRWLEEELLKARLAKKTVYLVGHTAPGADDRATNPTLASGHGGLLEHHNTRFLRLVKHHADIIVGQFFSNRHSDTFRVVYNDSGTPVSWMLMPPSVTPRRTQGGSNNPGIRLYKYDNTTGSVLDYSQYYLDLRRANREGRADWQLGYNLTGYYGMRDVTARAFHTLAESFTHPELGPTSFARYYRANSAMLYDGPENCYPQCQRYHYCAITRLLYSDYRTCLESPASALPSSGALPAAAPRFHGLLAGVLVAVLRRGAS